MVLVDTSVWIAHLRDGSAELKALLNDGEVACHPFIIGELACGNVNNRAEIFTLLAALPLAAVAEYDEMMRFIEHHRLMGKGLGYVDVHLLASALLDKIPLWTLDRKLKSAAAKLKIEF